MVAVLEPRPSFDSRPGRALRPAPRPGQRPPARPQLRLLPGGLAEGGRPSSPTLPWSAITAVVAAVVVAVALAVAVGAGAFASLAPPAAPAAAPGAVAASSSGTVVVEPGDTLWSIARRLQPSGDLRPLVQRLIERNGSAAIQPGDVIALP